MLNAFRHRRGWHDPRLIAELTGEQATAAKSLYPQYWTDDEFKPIAAEIESIFSKQGWRETP